MNHDAAVDTVCQLLNNMGGRAPAEVLLKYAGDRRLSPAQLEKMGHIYNTASTLAANERERGSVPHLLDVPAMLAKYAEDYGKAAPGARSFLGESRPAVRTHISADEVPVVWGGQSVQLKAASAPAAAPVSPFGGRVRAIELCKLAEEISDAMVNCRVDASEAVARAASALTGPAAVVNLHKLAADLHALHPALHNNQVLSKVASSAGVDPSGPVPESAKLPPMPRDRTGLARECASAALSLAKAAAAWDSCEEILGELAELSASIDPDDHMLARSIAKAAATLETRGKLFGYIKEAAPAAATNIVSFPTLRALGTTGEGVANAGASMAGEAYNRLSENNSPGVIRREAFDPFFTAAKGIGGLSLATAGSAAKATQGGLELAREFVPGGEISQYLDSQWGRKNREDADSAYLDRLRLREDTEAAAILQDLMIRDEIISRQDPERVLEAWREIRDASPEVAGSKSTLRLLLRQALSTQGMDIDTASAVRKFENSGTWNPKGPYRIAKD